MNNKRDDIRNIAIIAHVDHGKTTLVDELLKQSGIFRKNEKVNERVMDSNDLERERGITILSKNTAVEYKGTKINIIDTPGHADFGGEVERVLKMVSGVVLVVDAFEGPMPQTKFVLKKALDLDLPVIVAINKIDRPEARPEKVIDEVLDLFIELDANEMQIEFPVVFTSAKEGTSSVDMDKQEDDMEALFKSVIEHIPVPEVDEEGDLQVLISTIDYNEYVGRIGIGKVERGSIKTNQEAVMVNLLNEDKKQKIKITKLFEFEGLNRTVVEEARAGSIIAIAGVEGISIGDTICDVQNPVALPFVEISEPTISMVFSVNNGPFAGREGKYVTSRQIRERLFRELHTDVSLKVEETGSADSFTVSGRGELHLSILIETMRRQGYEFMVSKPKVLYKTIDGKKFEPMELVTIDVPEEFMGNVIEKLGKRKGEMVNMVPSEGGYTRLIFSIPARGLIGYRSEFMTDTKGNGIMNSIFDGYERFKGDIPTRSRGSLVASETGTSVTYGMYHVQDRGNLFIHAGTEVYEGMIVGMNSKTQDIDINVNKKKHLTSMRASGSEEALRLVPPIIFSLEEALEFIEDDELVEITPETIRLRKKILDQLKRKRAGRNN